MTDNEADRIVIWNKLKQCGFVEYLLGVKTKMSADLREIAVAHNSAPNFDVRVQILSVIVNKTKDQL